MNSIDSRRIGGEVVVNDGDSLTLGGQRIRLRGIDAPEFNQTCRRDGADYPCGREARSRLIAIVAGQHVTCDGWETDRYGRLLAVCMAGTVDLNRSQVEEGWAVAYGDYEDAERAAREAHRGVWAGEFDRPHEWRSTHGGMFEPSHDVWRAIVDGVRWMFGFS